MTATIRGYIYRLGIPTVDKPEKFEAFDRFTKQQLHDRLIELQKGYCEGNEKPKFKVIELSDDSVFIKAESESDFYFGLRIKKSIWDKL